MELLKRKGGLAVFAGVLILCATLLLGARTAYGSEEGDGWTLDDDGTLTITEDIEDLSADELNDGATYEWEEFEDQITKVVVGEDVTRIPRDAFYGRGDNGSLYNNLTSFDSSSSSLESIGVEAFEYVSSLKEVTLNEGVEVWNVAFASTGIEELFIPDNVTLYSDVFVYCDDLKHVVIAGSVELAGNAHFYGCTSLETVILEEGITYIPDQFLLECTNLQYFWIPSSVTEIGGATIDTDYILWPRLNETGCIIGYEGTIAEKYVERWDGQHGYPGDYPITFHAIDGDEHEGTWQTLTAATCTEDGEAILECDICGATPTRTIAATGHTWDSGVVTTEPTATAEGVRTYTCTVCGATKTETIAALDTTDNESQTDDTQTNDNDTQTDDTSQGSDELGESASANESDELPQTGDNIPMRLLLILSFVAALTATVAGYGLYRTRKTLN